MGLEVWEDMEFDSFNYFLCDQMLFGNSEHRGRLEIIMLNCKCPVRSNVVAFFANLLGGVGVGGQKTELRTIWWNALFGCMQMCSE